MTLKTQLPNRSLLLFAVLLPVNLGCTGKSDGTGKWAVSGLGKGQFFAEFSKAGFETKRVRLVIEKESMSSEPIKIALKKAA